MSEIKYKGIDLQKIKDVQVKLEPCQIETITFDKERLLRNLEKDETVMGEVLGAIKRYEMQSLEATEMYCICEMAKLWLKHCRDIQEILERLEEKKQEYLEGFRTHQEDELYGVACGFGDSIKICKEVGGMNE